MSPRRSPATGWKFPIRIGVLMKPKPAKLRQARDAAERIATLAGLDLFVPLTDDEREALAGDLADFPFVANESLRARGSRADSLFILARGHVAIVDDSAGARDRTQAAGDARGARRISAKWGCSPARLAARPSSPRTKCCATGSKRPGSTPFSHARPELVEALSQVVAARQAANDATLQSLSAEARAKQTVGRRADLVRRIKGFFAIS